MSINNPAAKALIGATCLALAVTGCTSTVTGTATPATDSTPTATSTDVFVGLNACQLLDQLNSGQGFNPGENKSRRNQCIATKPEFATYGLILDSVQGLAEFANTNTNVADISVNGRKAMKAGIPTGGCAIAVEVTDHASALAMVTMSRASEDSQACPNAQAFAERVEPLLPRAQ